MYSISNKQNLTSLIISIIFFLNFLIHSTNCQIIFSQENTEPIQILQQSPAGQFDHANIILISNSFANSESSHFGFSLQLMENPLRDKNAGGGSWIFIGDPKGNSTDPTYSKSREEIIQEPGVVWRCSLGQLAKESCQITHIDPDVRDNNIPYGEFRANSWVGNVMDSNSNRFVTCGQKRTVGSLAPNEPSIIGVCYWFNKQTMYQTWDSSKNDLNIASQRHRLLPLYENPNDQFNNRRPYHQHFNIRGQRGSLVDWSFGEAGTSVHLNDNELLIGAPGVRLWTGSVIIYRDVNRQSQNNRLEFTTHQGEFGTFSVLPRENQNSGVTGNHYYEYFGYSVTSGKYYSGLDERFYAGGSPRAAISNKPLVGSVTVFRIPPTGSNINDYRGTRFLYGDQFCSYFGAVLLSVDTTNDGYDELFVAAPFYNKEFSVGGSRSKREDGETRIDDDSSTSGMYIGDQGSVFVYSSHGKNRLEQNIIIGPNSVGARFGSAMVSLGDINEDSMNDIAIGAPYENGGQGAVYIFYGQSDLRNWRWTERIVPSQYNNLLASRDSTKMLGFGSSLASNSDVDNNGTPDLAIGSYLSQQVAILRSRPIIRIVGRIQIIGENGRPVQTIPNNFKSLTIESCSQFLGSRASETLPMEVTLRVDSRLAIIKSVQVGTESPRSTTYEDIVHKGEFKSCKNFNATLEKSIDVDDSDARIRPISIEQFIRYKGTDSRNNQIYLYKISSPIRTLGPIIDFSTNGPIDFQKFCPTCPFPTFSQPTVLNVDVASDCKDPNDCKPEINIDSWFSVDGTKKNSIDLNWNTRIKFHVSITNVGEPAYSPTLSIRWIKPNERTTNFVPRFSAFSSTPNECSAGYDNSQQFDKFLCTLGKSLKANKEEKQLEMEFDLSGWYASLAEHAVEVELNFYAGSSSIKKVSQKLALIPKFAIEMSSPKSEGIGFENPFAHIFDINLDGPSIPSILHLIFKFPTKRLVGGSEHEILLVRPKENYDCVPVEGTGHFADASKFVSSRKVDNNLLDSFNGTGTDFSRQRRDVNDYSDDDVANDEPIITADTTNDINSGPQIRSHTNVTKISCEENAQPTAIKCMIVNCALRRPAINFKITFEMILVNNVTTNDLLARNSILVSSLGSAKIYDGTVDQTLSETTLLKSASVIEIGEETPLWIYIVSGIGGFIVLALVTVILNWTGFFRRDKKDQLEQLKVQAGIQDHLLAANQRAPSYQGAADTNSGFE